MSATDRRPRSMRAAHTGQGTVEFAMVSLLLFTLLFGIVELGWLLFSYNEVTNAAREGARYAAVNGTMSRGLTTPAQIAAYTLSPTTVQQAIVPRVNLTDPTALNVTVTLPDGDLQPGHRVKIGVSYVYHPLFGFILPSPTLTLRGSSTMIVHY